MPRIRLDYTFFLFKKTISIFCVLLLFITTLSLKGQDYYRQAPDFEVVHKDGYKISLSSLRGKYVYVLFWASWCPTATTQMPNLMLLYEKYNKAKFVHANGFEILGISLDEEKDKWLNTIKEGGYNFPYQCLAPQMFDSPVVFDYNVTRLPTSFLISPEGYMLYMNMTMPELDAFLAGNAQTIPAMAVAAPPQEHSSSDNNSAMLPMSDRYGSSSYSSPAYLNMGNNSCKIFVGSFGNFGGSERWQRLSHIGRIQQITTADNSSDLKVVNMPMQPCSNCMN